MLPKDLFCVLAFDKTFAIVRFIASSGVVTIVACKVPVVVRYVVGVKYVGQFAVNLTSVKLPALEPSLTLPAPTPGQVT